MAIEVRVPTVLRQYTGGEKAVYAQGATVGAVLDELDRRHPGFKGQVLDDGQVRKFVNIYVNDEDIRYLGKLETLLQEGDVLSILPAVAGGGVA
ncbi:MAG: MoaD family protein [Chloroflexi bacterium]|nr:MoaD family protein [Chloroflexota bacterium]